MRKLAAIASRLLLGEVAGAQIPTSGNVFLDYSGYISQYRFPDRSLVSASLGKVPRLVEAWVGAAYGNNCPYVSRDGGRRCARLPALARPRLALFRQTASTRLGSRFRGDNLRLSTGIVLGY